MARDEWEDWQRVDAVFSRALEIPPERVNAFLEEACDGDPELRRLVERLLASARADDPVLEEAPDWSAFLLESPVLWGPEEGAGLEIAHYALLEQLGGSGAEVIYKARDNRLKRFVVLTFLPLTADPAEKQRLAAEIGALSALSHPALCPVYGLQETEAGRLFVVAAYFEGESLARKIERGPLAVEAATGCAARMAAGLQAAHEAGLVHRHLRPAHVLVSPENRVNLVGFGTALPGMPEQARKRLLYLSPEQVRGQPVDVQADVWALGVILYEMLTGRQPFQGASRQAVIQAVLNRNPEPIGQLRPALPDRLVGVVEKALQKDPARRYPRIAEMGKALEEIGARVV